MSDDTGTNPPDVQPLRKWLHDLNNRIGVILANAELMQYEQLSPKGLSRTKLIEEKALEVRDILREIGDRYFG